MLHTKYTRMAQIKEIVASLAIAIFGVGGLMLMLILAA